MKNYYRLIMLLLYSFIYFPIFSQQIYPNEDVRKSLNKYLRDIGATENPVYDNIGLQIWDLLSTDIIDKNEDMKVIGIYGFRALGSGQNTYILLKHKNDYEILQMTEGKYNESRKYTAILDDLQCYFIKYQDIDCRLMPLYNKVIYDVYVSNTQADELGQWFEWYKTEQKKYIESNN